MVCDDGKNKALKEVVKDENCAWKGGCFSGQNDNNIRKRRCLEFLCLRSEK